jgi:transcription initiation factor IIE alpha subunit
LHLSQEEDLTFLIRVFYHWYIKTDKTPEPTTVEEYVKIIDKIKDELKKETSRRSGFPHRRLFSGQEEE